MIQSAVLNPQGGLMIGVKESCLPYPRVHRHEKMKRIPLALRHFSPNDVS